MTSLLNVLSKFIDQYFDKNVNVSFISQLHPWPHAISAHFEPVTIHIDNVIIDNKENLIVMFGTNSFLIV
jgi:hypothetical protein